MASRADAGGVAHKEAGANARSVRKLGWWLVAATALLAFDARAQDRSLFRLERSEEDWSGITSDVPFGAQFKHLSLTNDITVSFGGDARWRLVWLDAPSLGTSGAEADAWFLQRLMLHADLRFDEQARLFLQLGAHEGVDRELPSPNDDDALDVQQAFVDLNARVLGGDATLRIGRQELVLGPRFVTARDSSNVRQRHNLLRVSYDFGAWRADAFAGRPIAVAAGAFDDQGDEHQEFYGARLRRSFSAASLEAYIYELDRDAASLAAATARDERVSLGVRAAGRRGDADFDAELTLQRGRFGDQQIRASGAAFDIGRRFPGAPFEPRFGARFTYGSGDGDLTDTVQETFAPPFPSSAWFGPNGLGSFSNTIESAATLTLNPRPELRLDFKLGGLWRAEIADFVYAGNLALPNTSGGDDAFIGASASLLALWFVSDNLVLAPNLSFLRVSDALQARGASDVAFAQFIVNVQF